MSYTDEKTMYDNMQSLFEAKLQTEIINAKRELRSEIHKNSMEQHDVNMELRNKTHDVNMELRSEIHDVNMKQIKESGNSSISKTLLGFAYFLVFVLSIAIINLAIYSINTNVKIDNINKRLTIIEQSINALQPNSNITSINASIESLKNESRSVLKENTDDVNKPTKVETYLLYSILFILIMIPICGVGLIILATYKLCEI